MNLKRSSLVVQDSNQKDLDNVKDYPTLADMMKEQNISSNGTNTVHHRRNLNALG